MTEFPSIQVIEPRVHQYVRKVSPFTTSYSARSYDDLCEMSQS